MEKKLKEIMIDKIIEEIRKQTKNILEAQKIDRKHYKMKISIDKFIKLANKLKEEDLKEEESEKNIIVTHNGNPYITFIIAVKAICNNINMDISINEAMVGVNSIIINIIQYVLNELNIKVKVSIMRYLEIEKIKNNIEKIIVLQDMSEYIQLSKIKNIKVQYNPIYNIALYIENEKFEILAKDIINYCNENFIEIEIYDAEDIDDALEQLKADNQGEIVLILTDEKDKVREKIKNEKINININENILSELEEIIIKNNIYGGNYGN